MTYTISKRTPAGDYTVSIDGERVGSIDPAAGGGYWTHVMLEHDSLADDSGYPNTYKNLTAAKAAVADLMERNGHGHA